MTCSVDRCEGPATSGNLCGKCRDLRDSTLIIGICFGMCVLIIAMSRLGRLI